MEVIEPGHVYALDFIGPPDAASPVGEKEQSHIQFYRGPKGDPHEMRGTTNEEVLEVLIDRMEYLNTAVPCEENKRVIKHLVDARAELEQRTIDRERRGVEGTDQD